MDINIALPTFASELCSEIPDVLEISRHAEAIGLDGVWAGDHLSSGAPFLESVVALSGAAAVTQRIRLGFGVMLLALRPQAWVAKQIGSLQHLSGQRVELGVGVGGAPAEEWTAAGVPFRERGRRTDLMLRALPDLLSGKATALHTEAGTPTVALAPAVAMPPIWIGGSSDAALRRAVEFGAGWLASLLTPEQIAVRRSRLAELAEASGVTPPRIGTTMFPALAGADRERAVRWLQSVLVSRELAERMVIGSVSEFDERLQRYADAGVSNFVVNAGTQNLLAQCDLVAQVRESTVGR